jgi:hypothetical protein
MTETRASGAVLALGLLCPGCGSLLGTSFVPPPEFPHDAHQYSLVVDADPSLECEQLQQVVSVLLMAQLFAGD